jgi:hypothetical protein
MSANTQAVFDLVTLAIALLGAGLGIFNAWRTWVNDRVRLKVKVSHGVGSGGVEIFLIEVLNLSAFPVTVTHIGFDLLGTDRHAQIPIPRFVRGETLPVRLESRTALTVFQPLAESPPNGWVGVRRAYALTACGLKRVSSGRAFDEYRATGAAGDNQGLL